MKKLYLYTVVMIGILIPQYSLSANTDIVTIEDKSFGNCIKSELGIDLNDDITTQDALAVTQLSCNSKSITSIEGIEAFINIEELELLGNNIKDISPISNLDQITYLNLSNNQVEDITPITELTKMTVLSLARNQIVDITAISNLKEITSTNLNGNKINDITPFQNLDKITHMQLGINEITDISVLSDKKSLEFLELASNKELTDISPLSELRKLRHLWLLDTSVINIEPIKEVKSLQAISVCSTGIEDISPLANLSNLESIDISMNNVEDISAIANKPNLVYLKADNNIIKDITSLSDAYKIETVNMYRNQIADISPLAGKSSLTYSNFSLQKIELEPIETFERELITGTIINRLGVISEVELGYPEYETANLSATFSAPGEGLSGPDAFSGTITIKATLRDKPTMTYLSEASINEEVELSDEQLIELFNVIQERGEKIIVDSSLVDYSVPGQYEIAFSDESGTTVKATLDILDVLPTITTKVDTIKVKYNDQLENLIELFGINASEISDNDLLHKLDLEHKINTTISGTYPIQVSVADEEGNIVSKKLTLIVGEKVQIEVPSEKPTEEPSEKGSEEPSEKGSEEPSEKQQENTQMTLGDTGGFNLIILLILSLTISCIFLFKKIIKT